ncbi:HAD family hydrolase [Endozoicomonas arenosclerae]|uniref:HAD family hydrolase n=1 Tax=Endozoicomonas arenosclerae TaxID=1633495 RepID=UPI0007832766|nr:HAD-IA family hydrolase [Endozoicomonas arenosclerae]
MSHHNAIEGLFFDLDGTLLDTSGDFIAVINQMLAKDNLPETDSALIRDHVSEGSRKLIQLAYKIEATDPALEPLRNRLLNEYDLHISNKQRKSAACLYEGIEDLLMALDENAIRWGVVTNKPFAYAHVLLDQVNLGHRYQALICPDHVKKAKPDPESLLLACQSAGTRPEQSIYIGDHLRDIDAGRNAGMITIAALYGYISPDDHPEEWQADHSVATAREILPLLEKYKWQLPRRHSDV